MENDDAPDPKILAAIADALDALNQSQPALILEITEAIRAPGRGRKQFASVEAAARRAATAVFLTDPEAAETLFSIAELLALARDGDRRLLVLRDRLALTIPYRQVPFPSFLCEGFIGGHQNCFGVPGQSSEISGLKAEQLERVRQIKIGVSC
jgi:hypothetical protein